MRLAAGLGIPVSVRSVHRNELYRSAGAFLAGTLDELRPIISVDGVSLPDASEKSQPLFQLFRAFFSLCRAEDDHEWGEIFHA
jgi:branched-subunit amino acid aminotransferase/4-amino-4-deoxychorismate lyase